MKVVTQDSLRGWLDRLAKESVLIAPRDVDGIALYRPVKNSGQVVLAYTRPKMSAKEVVFPSTDGLLSIEKIGRDVTLSEPEPRNQVIFGLRPCDAHGIAVLDAVFIDKEPVDLNYRRRRDATTLIGLACSKMWDGCFCTSVGGGPDDSSHMDVLLTAVDKGYVVEVVTDKGKALAATMELKDAVGETPRPGVGQREAIPALERWTELFNNKYWDRLADRCLGCRVCAYVCPTCRCFDVRDQVAERGAGHAVIERLRCWDACTRLNYRVIAGGHNPRATEGQRLRNRFFCKFYYLPQDYAATGCVGCGRCIEACPVNVDVVEVLRQVAGMGVSQ